VTKKKKKNLHTILMRPNFCINKFDHHH